MERLYLRIFQALPIRVVAGDDDLRLLNPEELRLVLRTERYAMAAAVLLELIAYLTIFLPIYSFPAFFEAGVVHLGGPFVHATDGLPVLRNAWMLVVTVGELYLLLLVNLAAVHGIAVATGYIHRRREAARATELVRIAVESRFADQQRFGIDPFERMHPWVLFLYLAVNRLKGLIGGAIIRAVLVNLFGREILRVYLDFSGMPLYMLINVLTCRAILRNARVVIMGQTSVEMVCRQLPDLQLSQDERSLIYDTLQYIAVNKRDYHANHYHLSKAIIDRYGIPLEEAHRLPDDYLDKLKIARREVADICRLVIVLGFLLDGSVSWRERRQLERLNQAGILQLSYADLRANGRDFVDGQGLDAMTQSLLNPPPVPMPAG